jgi:hypothetical protein
MNKLQTVYKLVKPSEDINTGITVKYIHSGRKFPVSEIKAYVFTSEELEQLLTNAFDAGCSRGYNLACCEAVNSDCLTPTKEEYIENLLNKEK